MADVVAVLSRARSRSAEVSLLSSMTRHSQLVFLVLCFLFLCCAANETPQAYVVYLGGGSSTSDSVGYGMTEASEAAAHLQLLSTVILSEGKERLALLHSYSHAFRGFSAMLTEGEAKRLSGNAGVVSVFRDQILPLHTTRSWDFLDAESGMRWRRRRMHLSGDDVIIGIVDTGIWPESPSFDDAGIGEIPARWKGVCMEGSDFKKSHCNKKLIGARYYDTRIDPMFPSSDNNSTASTTATPTGSPRDSVGHGTHTASTAAGAAVGNASYYGLAAGTARGGSPSSRLAMYKACSLGGCAGSNILKAIDDAVRDGVDVISISVGMSSAFQSDFLSDPIAIGAFHATERGVMVVCSGGNDGPEPFTVVNSAPWIMTVAASSIDRGYESDVVLGDGAVIKGSAITFSNLTSSKSYPLVFAKDVAAEFTPVYEASNCYPGSLDPQKAAGKIVVCVNGDPTVSRRVKKLVAEGSRARGLVLIDQIETGSAFDSGAFPFSQVGAQAGDQILRYINSTKNPVGTILPSKDVDGIRPAPVVAYFSSRGPGGLTESILKPDVMAPGVGILAAWIPVADASTQVPPGKKPSNYVVKSGTSMASPHVAGAAALLKSVHPRWTPSMIKSALMTTATASNNMGKPVTCSTGSEANHHDTGAGEINPLKALDPGLVYETTAADYTNFLCYHGYKQQLIRSIAGTNFTCPANSTADRIASINYPSISVAKLDARRGPVKVGRTATNVGAPNSTYSVTVDAPPGLVVGVSPQKLVFSRSSPRAYFEVTFESKGATKGYRFGAIAWSDGRHWVRSVFAVNVVA